MIEINELRKLFNEKYQELDDLKIILDSSSAQIEFESKELASSTIGILNIHAKRAGEAGKNTIGLKDLIGALGRINQKEFIMKVHLRSEGWAGYCVLSLDQSCLLGCALIQVAKDVVKKTPPNWDGSQKMLDEFDKKN